MLQLALIRAALSFQILGHCDILLDMLVKHGFLYFAQVEKNSRQIPYPLHQC